MGAWDYADGMPLTRLHMRKILRSSQTQTDPMKSGLVDTNQRDKQPRPVSSVPLVPSDRQISVTPLRNVSDDELAELLHSAYAGTVDDEGEDGEAALSEIRETLNGQYGELLEESSGVVVGNGTLTSAIIVTLYRGSPLIAYILTRPSRQRHGYATELITRACDVLAAQGYEAVNLAVTVGSQGESLYRALGFVEVVRD